MRPMRFKATYYLRRAIYYLRRGLEVWLFTPTPCASGAVTEILARENRDQMLRDRALGGSRGRRSQ